MNVVTDLHVLTPHPTLTSDRAWNWQGLESTVVPGSCGGLTSGSWVALLWLPWSGLKTMNAHVDAHVPPREGDAGGSTCSASSGRTGRGSRNGAPSTPHGPRPRAPASTSRRPSATWSSGSLQETCPLCYTGGVR